MSKKIGIIVAACFAFALCFALVGCGGVNKARYTGTWDLESGSDESLSADNIKLMKSLGLEVTIMLNENGTGSLNLFGEATNLTWEASTDSEGTVTFGNNTAALKLQDDKLVIEDSAGSSMTFVKGAAAASAGSASASPESASSTAAESAAATSSESAAASSGAAESASSAAAESAGSSEAAAASSAAAESASAASSAAASSGSAAAA